MMDLRCPDDQKLWQLLNIDSVPGLEAELVAHIEHCKSCQDRLARIALGERREAGSLSTEVGSLSQSLAVPEDRTEAGEVTLDVAGAPNSHDTAERTEPQSDQTTEVEAGLPQDRRPQTSRMDEIGSDWTRSLAQDAATALPRREEGRPVITGYELLDELGEGGMGVVYRARQVGLNRQVALKMIRGGGHVRPEHLSRFRIEAEAVARLRHANIVQIYDIGEADRLPFISLELLEGGSLSDRLDGTPLPAWQAAELTATLARAIQFAHEANIIHRDLKPSNLLFDRDGTPKITDFGLAKRIDTDSGQTQTGQIMGSPSYMAPEQARGHTRDVGPAADIYALGAILYEMLTGRPPFRGETPMETIRQVVDDDVVPPSRLVPRVSRDLETIALKCLEKDPSRRYRSAADLADDVDRFRKGETIHARRASSLERGAKWARRRPAVAALVTIGVMAFLGLTVGGAYYERSRRFEAENRRLAGEAQSERVVKFLTEANQLEAAARDAEVQEALLQSQRELSNMLGRLEPERDSRLQGLPERVRATLDRVDAKLGEVRRREEEQKSQLADRRRYLDFLQLRTKAQLHSAEFELDAAGRRTSLRETARAALAVYAREPRVADGEWRLTASFPAVLNQVERGRIVDSCYDLLLMLSEAIEPAEGLKVLDRAAELRPMSTAAYHVRRAGCLEALGDVEGRKREEAAARALAPQTALDHFLLGREHSQRRRWDEAVASLEAAVSLDPDLTAARLLMAIASFNVQPRRLGDALGHLNDCIRSHPELAGLYLIRALVHGERGNLALPRIAPGDRAGRAASRARADEAFHAAERDYAAALERPLTADLRYVLLVNRGGMFLQAGHLERSMADLEGAIALNPRPYQAYLSLAQLDQRRGLPEEASRAYARAIERAADPATRAALFRSRGRLFASPRELRLDRRQAALADLAEAIRLEPRDASRKAGDHVERARLFFSAGQFESSLEAAGSALTLAPGLPSALRLKISALMAIRRHDEVLRSCDLYLKKDPDRPPLQILEIRGLARFQRRDYSGAIADQTRAIEQSPDLDPPTRARLLNHRGWAYHLADAPRLALEDFETSIRLAPRQGDALAGRGLARIRLGDHRAAVADAEASVKLARTTPTPDDGADPRRQVYLNAARIYAQAVDLAAAEVTRQGQQAVSRYRAYRARAMDLLREALHSISPAERPRVLSDPALRPLGDVVQAGP